MVNNRGVSDLIWSILIWVVILLFVIGFYFLLSGETGNTFSSFYHSKDSVEPNSHSSSPDKGGWKDVIGSEDSDKEVIVAPPVLPS